MLLTQCAHDHTPGPLQDSRRLIIIVIDGPRYTETWGDELNNRMPFQKDVLKPMGVLCTQFFNDGVTFTNPGHDAITTGVNESINNSGNEFPTNASFFQYWRKQTGREATDEWIITSKDKLAVLADCKDVSMKNQFNPSTDCGIAGLATGYRDDTTTLRRALEILKQYHPHVVLIQFKEPDVSGHANDWNAYLNGISSTDNYVQTIYQFLQSDSLYADNTDLFITNDHGRHLDGWLDGFVNHGDTCYGCRHISLLAVGPDIKENKVVDEHHDLRDLNATMNYLLGIDDGYSEGEVMESVLRKE